MKKFLYKTMVFLGVLVIIVLLLSLFEGDRVQTNEYMAALTDKHNRINTINGAKIILAGGSNLVFGVDSEKIETELKIPVVNLGLHAQLGLKFILQELKDVAKEGDVILLSIEHEMTTEGNPELQKTVAYYNSFATRYFQDQNLIWIQDYKTKLNNYHILFKKTIGNVLDEIKDNPVYSRNGLNKYGDGIYHLDLPSSSVLGSKSIIKNNKKEHIKLLNDFHLFAQKKGIKVVFSYGAYENTEYIKNKKVLELVHQAMKSFLTIEMISELDDFVYPASYFYDSVYHLNKTGRDVHTDNLVSKIKSSHTFGI